MMFLYITFLPKVKENEEWSRGDILINYKNNDERQ